MWNQFESFFAHLPSLVSNIILAALAVIAGLFIKWIITRFLHHFSRRKEGFSLFRALILRLGKPVNVFLPLLVLDFVLPLMQLGPKVYNFLNKTTGVFLVISFATILIGIVKVAEDYVYHFYDLAKPDDLKERKIRTQLQFIRKLLIAVIVALTVCAILLSFDNLRRIGAGLLTGVGISGIIIGFAAQRSLGNLFAGLQIAFTQPIRIDDSIVAEGESGIVEDITLTYVVLNLWDQRRLILPINYFIERPFQNLTRTSSELLGTVSIFLDYTTPVEELRKEFNRVLQETNLWDKRASALQVINASENTIEVRALVSAGNAGALWDLRCFVREQLIAYIQKNFPVSLPKTRIIIQEKLSGE